MRTHSAGFRALLTAVLLVLPAAARAEDAAGVADSTPVSPELFDTDRPDLTNGSSRVEPGVVQVETGWSRTVGSSQVLQSFGDALVRVGVSRAFELRIVTPGIERESLHGRSDSEWGQTGAGFKLGRTSADGNRGVGVLADLAIPARHPSRLTEAHVVLAGDLDSGDFGASANLGLHRVTSDGDAATSVLASLSISRGMTKRVSVFAELAGERATDAGASWDRFADGGASWAVARHLQLDASAGRDLEADSPWTVGAGLSKRW